MAEFGITHSEAGLLMTAVVVPGAALSLMVGFLSEKFNVKTLGVASTLAIAAGAFLTGWAESFHQLLMGRFILGIGGAFAAIAMPTLISRWFQPDELGKIMGIYSVNTPIALVAAFLTVGILAEAQGWRPAMQLCFLVSLTALPVFTLLTREGPLKTRNLQTSLKALKNLELWKLGVSWLLFNWAVSSLMTWMPKYFSEQAGFPIAQASLTASLFMVAAGALAPIHGWLSDKTGKPKLFLTCGGVLAAAPLSLLTLLPPSYGPWLLIFTGVFAAMLPPIVFASPGRLLGPNMAGIGFGVLTVCLNLGIVFGPPTTGFLLDLTGSYLLTLMSIAVVLALTFIPAVFLKMEASSFQ